MIKNPFANTTTFSSSIFSLFPSCNLHFKGLLLVFVAITVSACDSSDSSEVLTANATPTKSIESIGKTEEKLDGGVIIKQGFRKWADIVDDGVIRASKLRWESNATLPRSGSTAIYHQQLFEQFAALHGLRVKWVVADSLADMFKDLENNRSDIIPRHLTRLASRQETFQFTRAITRDHEQLIGATSIENSFSLDAQLQVLLPAESSYLSTAESFDNWKIIPLGHDLSTDQLADKLVDESPQVTILDKSAVDNLLGYRDDIIVLHQFDEPTVQAWMINKNQPQLLNELNNFIQSTALQRILDNTRTLDLKELKKNKLPLRMITRNSPETYFLWRGELMGFEYDLMKEFAKRQGLTLQVIVADSYEEMVELLNQGKGDIIAAGISRTEERKNEHTFSIRYNRVDEQLVAHKDSKPIKSLEDLKGRSLHLRRSSAFWSTGESLSQEYGVNLVAVDEEMSTELLITEVANKVIDLTIADSNLIAIEKSFRNEIVTPLTLQESIPWAYIVRKNNGQLLNAINAYVAKEYRQTFYNVIKQKYFTDQSRKEKYREDRITKDSNLSPYDSIVQEQAKRHQFDWRLITAQMYQESKFNPKAKSFAGALGLMQVLPSTAEELGYSKLTDPEESIAAGVDYLNWTKQRFDSDLPLEERIFFALASYNAGYGHVYDAQRLARQKGLNPKKWFGNVERTMLLLQQPKYYKKARFGYVRGTEPVNYVRSIHQRYLSYVEVAQ